ncbi:minor capsid protein [Capybara microvirus Cap1_SP_77]|nr:minor capsid protein [Capybara microvirus Cap1_SP_77]
MGIMSQIVGFGLGQLAQNHAFNQNKELANIQNQYNIDQWQRENVYNSPAQQMERLRAAGLNPNAALGSFGNESASLSGKLTAGTPQTPLDIASLANVNAQNRLIDAQTSNLSAQTRAQNIANEYIAPTSEMNLREMESRIGVNSRTADKMLHEMDLLDAQTLESLARKAKIDLENHYYPQLTQANLNLIKSQLDINEKQLDVMTWSILKFQHEISNLDAQSAMFRSQASANYAQAQLDLWLMENYYPAQTKVLKAQKDLLEAQTGTEEERQRAQQQLNDVNQEYNDWLARMKEDEEKWNKMVDDFMKSPNRRRNDIGMQRLLGIDMSTSDTRSRGTHWNIGTNINANNNMNFGTDQIAKILPFLK